MRYLILDVSNFLYKSFFRHIKDEDAEMSVAICQHIALTSMNSYFKKYEVDELVVVFDAPFSWRKKYTQEKDLCITHKKYKGTRREEMTPADREKLEYFLQHFPNFMELFRDHSTVIFLYKEMLEADDLIAGFIQAHPDDEHILLSSDKDFMQLLGRNNLRLISPVDGKERTLSEYNNDPFLFMYEKAFRGDSGDNVMSAYPRLRTEKIRKAYDDPVLHNNLMQNTYKVLDNDNTDANGMPVEYEYLTEDVFEENILLMDLTKQPDGVRKLMDKTIQHAKENRGKFNYIRFLQYCGKYQLNNIIQYLDNYVPMLTCGKKKKGA